MHEPIYYVTYFWVMSKVPHQLRGFRMLILLQFLEVIGVQELHSGFAEDLPSVVSYQNANK